jgi:hypothetical protein
MRHYLTPSGLWGSARGDLRVESIERDEFEIRLQARRTSNDSKYRIVKNADQRMSIRRLRS